MATQTWKIANGARLFVQSDRVAVSMAMPNAAAHGGTECNCVSIDP